MIFFVIDLIALYFLICMSAVLLYNDLHKQYVCRFMQGLWIKSDIKDIYYVT